MSDNRWIVPLFLAVAAFAPPPQLIAQSATCVNQGDYHVSRCCSTLYINYFEDPNGNDGANYTYQYCCGVPQSVLTTTGGYCDQVQLRVPGVLEKLLELDPEGNMLVASCSGQLVPLQRPAAWSPDRAPKKMDLGLSWLSFDKPGR